MKIKYDIDNNCVSCPQGCIHCGRGDYRFPVAIVCENCGEDNEELYDTPDGYYCEGCLTKAFHKVSLEDIEENEEKYDLDDWEKVK